MITKNQTMMKRCGKVYIEMIGLKQPFLGMRANLF
jgi:hypothetical protein